VIVPYTWLSGDAIYAGQPVERVVDGATDTGFRVTANLYGAPAMGLKEFAAYEQDVIVGASLRVIAPTGQYDNTRIVNIGGNRWSLKPEIGVSKAAGPWTLELAAAATFYTDNDDFNGGKTRSQENIYTLQAHVIRSFSRGIWAPSAQPTSPAGGRRSTASARNDLQQNWRIGGTLSLSRGPVQLGEALREQRRLRPHGKRFRRARHRLAVPLGRRALRPAERTIHVQALPVDLRFRPVKGSGHPASLVDAAIERAIEATDPRIRAASGYRRKLEPAVVHALDHVKAIALGMPAPVEASRATYGNDARLAAFFASPERMSQVFGADRALIEYLASSAGAGTEPVLALLLVERSEKKVLGMALQGDQVQRDVAQGAGELRPHRLVDPCAAEDDLRRALAAGPTTTCSRWRSRASPRSAASASRWRRASRCCGRNCAPAVGPDGFLRWRRRGAAGRGHDRGEARRHRSAARDHRIGLHRDREAPGAGRGVPRQGRAAAVDRAGDHPDGPHGRPAVEARRHHRRAAAARAAQRGGSDGRVAAGRDPARPKSRSATSSPRAARVAVRAALASRSSRQRSPPPPFRSRTSATPRTGASTPRASSST